MPSSLRSLALPSPSPVSHLTLLSSPPLSSFLPTPFPLHPLLLSFFLFNHSSLPPSLPSLTPPLLPSCPLPRLHIPSLVQRTHLLRPLPSSSSAPPLLASLAQPAVHFRRLPLLKVSSVLLPRSPSPLPCLFSLPPLLSSPPPLLLRALLLPLFLAFSLPPLPLLSSALCPPCLQSLFSLRFPPLLPSSTSLLPLLTSTFTTFAHFPEYAQFPFLHRFSRPCAPALHSSHSIPTSRNVCPFVRLL